MRIFAFKNKKETESASGGAFVTIAKYLLEEYKNRVSIYGVSFDENMDVLHERIITEQDLWKLQGSKYVQSNIGSAYKQAEKDLIDGRVVLFSGTPCQIAGLNSFLDKSKVNRKNLITIDIICHGTPAQRIWKSFQEWIETLFKSQIDRFSFRYSKARWKRYTVYVKFKNGKELINSYEARLYTDMFLKKIMMRNACYRCRFSNLDRVSDITIGDFWGIEKVVPKFGFRDNVSEVLVSTEKGQKIIDVLAEYEGILLQECCSNDFLKYQHNLNRPTEEPQEASQFQRDFQEKDMEYILKKYAGYSLSGKIKYYIIRLYHECIGH